MTLADRVTQVLTGAGIAHAMIGAGAMAAAGVARSTFDLDFLTTDTRVLDEALWRPPRAAGIAVEVCLGDIDDPLAGAVRASAATERPVDVIVGRFAWQTRAVARARVLLTGMRVALARDVILLKLFAGGVQDMWDVRQLLAVVDDPALVSDVEADLGDLPPAAAALWARIRDDG